MIKKRQINESLVKVSKKEIDYAVEQKYVVFYDIKWDTDGQKIDELPKAVAVPKELFDADFDFEMESTDFLSDKYGWCIHSLKFKK